MTKSKKKAEAKLNLASKKKMEASVEVTETPKGTSVAVQIPITSLASESVAANVCASVPQSDMSACVPTLIEMPVFTPEVKEYYDSYCEEFKAISMSLAGVVDSIERETGALNACDEEMAQSLTNIKEEHRLYTKKLEQIKFYDSMVDCDDTYRLQYFGIEGHRPKPMEIVTFKVSNSEGEREGLAVAMDANRYYLALDLYPEEGKTFTSTTALHENIDGTSFGMWPHGTTLSMSTSIERRVFTSSVGDMRDFLGNLDKSICDKKQYYIDHIKELFGKIDTMEHTLATQEERRETITNLQSQKAGLINRLAALNQRLVSYVADTHRRHLVEEACVKAEQALGVVQEQNGGEADKATPDTDIPASSEYTSLLMQADVKTSREKVSYINAVVEHFYPSVPSENALSSMQDGQLLFVRNLLEQTAVTQYPSIFTRDKYLNTRACFQEYKMMAEFLAQLREEHAPIYIMSNEYFEEFWQRRKLYYKDVHLSEVLKEGRSYSGFILFNRDGEQTILAYRLAYTSKNTTEIEVLEIRDGKLASHIRKNACSLTGESTIHLFVNHELDIHNGGDYNHCHSVVRTVIAHLSMERDNYQAVHRFAVEDDPSVAPSAKQAYTTVSFPEEGYDDISSPVIIRDENWYHSFVSEGKIPPTGFISYMIKENRGNKALVCTTILPLAAQQ